MITLLNSLEGAIKNFFSGGDIMNFKKILIALAIAWAVTGSLVLPVFASDDLYGFQMKLGTYQEEASTGYHYRQTASNANPWKVGVYTSAEGNGSYYRAYLMGQKNCVYWAWLSVCLYNCKVKCQSNECQISDVQSGMDK